METNDVVKELGTKITIPKGIREAIYDKLFKNLCIAILVLLYFIFVNLGYIKLKPSVFEEDLHVFAGILIILTIVSFELGYRRSDMEISMHGVELLFLSIVTLFMPYIYFHRGIILRFVYSFAAIYITVYYLIKCVYIYINEIRKYKNGLSDIKEIVDDEEEETYLDEPSERKFRNDEEEEPVKSALTRMFEKPKKEIKKITAKKTTKAKKEKMEKADEEKPKAKKTTTKKSTIAKKTTKTKKEKTEKVDEEKPKAKKTTTKKSTTVKKTTKKKNEDKEG